MSNMVGGKVLTWDEKVQALKYNDSFNEFGSGGGRATVPASERAKYDQNQKNLYELWSNDSIFYGYCSEALNKDINDFTKYIKKVIPNQKIILSEKSLELDLSNKK